MYVFRITSCVTFSDLCYQVEARIAEFAAKNGQTLFGGKLLRDVEPTMMIPDNKGASIAIAPVQAGSLASGL